MLNLSKSKYFLPTKELRELSIMLAIYKDPELSQQGIGALTNLSGAMVNNYLKNMRQTGVVEISKKNNRDKVYLVSNKGKRILMKSLIDCSAELVQHVSNIKRVLNEKLVDFFNNNTSHKVVLYGAADTAHFVLEAISGIADVSIVAIVDNDSSKWGEKLSSITIVPPSILESTQFDTIIICSYAHQEEIFQSISHFLQTGIHIVQLSSI